MAFLLYRNEVADIPAWDYIPCGAIAVNVGLALAFSGGNAGVASGTTVPTHVCMCDRTVGAAGDTIPAVRILPSMVFETTNSVTNSALRVGEKRTISVDGLGITDTATDGVAEIVSFDGTAAGDRVRVRF